MPAYSPTQTDKAYEAIQDGAVLPLDGHLFVVVSSNGNGRYLVNTELGTCTCPAGENGRPCYHQLAAEMMQVEVETVAAFDWDSDDGDDWPETALDIAHYEYDA